MTQRHTSLFLYTNPYKILDSNRKMANIMSNIIKIL